MTDLNSMIGLESFVLTNVRSSEEQVQERDIRGILCNIKSS